MFKLAKYTLAAALALAGFQQASAQTTMHFVGSTAYRASTVNAIINRLNGCTAICDDDGASHTLNNSTYSIFKGTYSALSAGNQSVTIYCHWTGSTAGIEDVTGNNPDKFLLSGFKSDGTTAAVFTACSVSGSNATFTGGSTAGIVASGHETFSSTLKAECTMEDAAQSFTKFTSPSLTQQSVGILAFAWVAGFGTPSDVTNVNPNVLRAMWTAGGYLSAEVLSGNSADHAAFGDTDGVLMYAIGRNDGSGTRLNAFAEPGIGIFHSVYQFTTNSTVVVAAGGTAPSGNVATDIALDTRGIQLAGGPSTVSAGNGGEESGGTLANNVRYDVTAVSDDSNGNGPRHIAFITYLGEPDSVVAVTGTGASINGGNAKYLTYNGVAGFASVYYNNTVTTSSGSTTVVATASPYFAGIVPGQAVRGSQIQADTVVLSGPTTTTNANDTIVISKTANGATTDKMTVSTLLPNTIRTGAYSFWDYEFLAYDPAVVTVGSDIKIMADAIATQIKSGNYINGTASTNTGDYFANGIADDTNMTVTRGGAGAPVVTKY